MPSKFHLTGIERDQQKFKAIVFSAPGRGQWVNRGCKDR